SAREHITDLERLAPRAETGRGREQRECRNQERQPGRDHVETEYEGGERCAQEHRADHVREARGTRVLDRPLADERLHELEVAEAREAVAAAERQTDDELEGE